MIPIKFRGQRLDKKEWVYGYAVKRGSEWWIFNETVDWNINPPFGEIAYHQYKVDPKTVGQFTGLCDKNKKEIYKDDVYHQGDKNITYTVVWHDSGFIGKQNKSSSFAGLSYWQDVIEIIGNIHENPELSVA